MKLRNIFVLVAPFLAIAVILLSTFNSNSIPTFSEPAQPFSVSLIKKDELFNLVNSERTKQNIPSLYLSENLNETALIKCKDMVKRDYWSHTDPDGNKSLVLNDIRNPSGIYAKGGENLANGFNNASEVVNGWMNSPEHKRSILDKDFTLVGYAVCYSPNFRHEGKKILVVQHFARPN